MPPECITSARARIAQLVRDAGPDRGRDVVVLGIDGIPFALARDLWPRASLEPMVSVFPTTSSTCWLSSLTGLPVSGHGIPGVMLAARNATVGEPGDPAGDATADGLVNVFAERGVLQFAAMETIFTDAGAIGVTALAVPGDWEPHDCGWRDALLRGAVRVPGHRFYTHAEPGDAATIVARVAAAVDEARRTGPAPRLIWCFVDVDRHIHAHGYDGHVREVLARLEALAVALVRDGVTVAAHSDHGLVPTRHCAELEALLARLCARHGAQLGGAGRTRWLHVDAAREQALFESLQAGLPETVDVMPADRMFAPGSLSRARSGAILLVARGEAFLTFDGQTYEHGSWMPDEILVPFARWSGAGVRG